MRFANTLSFIALWAAAAGCGKARNDVLSTTQEAWNEANNPDAFTVSLAAFDSLPQSGILPETTYPWSDDYWQTKKAGIAYRWQTRYPRPTKTYRDYRYPVLSRSDVEGEGSTQLVDKLSPAEKYDLLMSRYDFPLVRREFRAQQAAVGSNGDVPKWFGICHGLSPASLLEPEPGSKVIATNAEGIKIPFYTSDIKALMSKTYADFSSESERFIGERCDVETHKIRVDRNGRVLNSACRDTNPGTLHLVLATYLGQRNPANRQGFIADITKSQEVWNQAVVGFKVTSAKAFNPARDPAARHRAPGTVQLVRVKTEMYYVDEITPHKVPKKSERVSYTSTLHLEYTLELDSSGMIIGGEWISDDRPDFIWATSETPKESEILSYSAVRNLLDRSLQD